MPETLRKKLVKEGVTEATIKTAEIISKPVLHASDALFIGGIPVVDPVFTSLALLGKQAVKMTIKNIDRAKGIQEVDLIHQDFGRVRVRLKVRTLPDGKRLILKKLDEKVIRPTEYYKQFKAKIETRNKIQNELRKRYPKETRGMTRWRHVK